MLNRSCLNDLETWARNRSGGKPLIIRGARQVGKTTVARMLAERLNYRLIELNLEKPWRFTSVLESLDPHKVVEAIEFELNIDIDPEDSILFFDEAQAQPAIFPLLRYFHEDAPEFKVMVTGSLLEFVLAEPKFSIPVGRIDLTHLGPLDFTEFLEALGNEKALKIIHEFNIGDGIDNVTHDGLNSLLRMYTIVGGMPEAVQTFVETERLKDVEKIKAGIIETFRLDFNKYHDKADPKLLTVVFDSLPRLLGKKLIYSHIDPHYRSNALAEAVNQLSLARVVSKVYNTHANGIPLGAEKDNRYFKTLALDVGLLLTQFKLNPIEVEQAKELNFVNNGTLAVQVIGQQLYYQQPRYSEPELYYWAREKRASSAEVDYLVTDDKGNIIPVEVKAGKTGRLRSLQIMIREKALAFAVRFNSERPSLLSERRETAMGAVDFKLLSLPHYLVPRLPRILDQLTR